MKLMQWSDHFVTGLQTVDAQHQALVHLINSVASHLASGGDASKRAVGPLLNQLTDYAATHFKYEEGLMRQLQVAPEYYAQHVRTHDAFVEEVIQMRRQYEQGTELSGTDLLRFLTSWLTFHILSEDKRMARQVHAIRAGCHPEQAYGELDAPEGAPQAVYMAALIDLFGLLTTRNRTLAQANEEVRKTKDDLETANRLLEARVEERTHSLAEVNASLLLERQALVASIKQLELTRNQLLQAEKMAAVGQLAAGVAHEINNPMAFIGSNMVSLSRYTTEILALTDAYEKTSLSLPPHERAAFEALRKSVDMNYLRQDIPDLLKESIDGLARVKRIVNDLQEFSQADETRWEPVDINLVLDNALSLVGEALEKKVDILKELSPLPLVACNFSQMRQVFVNLLFNAAHAIERHGTIAVRTGATHSDIWIEISDNGRGMSETIMKRIFEPFFTTRPVGTGTGLGLSISWEIIHRHRGSIAVNSTENKGSTFRITLPQFVQQTSHLA